MKKLVFYLSIINLFLFFIYGSLSHAQELTVLEKIDKTGLLEVGIREDAVPFGYRDINGNLEGLCLDFIAILREKLKQKLNKKVIAIKLYKSTLYNRFELASDRIVDLECGPNTIREVPEYQVQFSQPFFLTGTQLLVSIDQAKTINPDGSLENVDIGVLRNTTNEQLIAEKYPLANLVKFEGVTGRSRGIQALRGDKIDAFASDGILLVGEALIQNLRLGVDYSLVPTNPIDCEEYGLILPDNNPEWLSFINSVIQAPSAQNIYRDWFGEIAPQIESIQLFCQSKRVLEEVEESGEMRDTN
ncbi:putative extracellular solute-binding protein, family 3 precursor [Crocosphaera subtropica ATCC 51142]|uniref:Extracellular solute-binding protein, family 3 n=1 Tax=Crocosphaera subtropica (strain ATCC 51142 / BH68) TaxID=43989 RepID=B1WWJ6_CROS5|nr:amino acid ABC transporter substrate-binding protein [Crocosphaera subtropica]ACB50720.1 putative extracellular solute-binding protein, family 3 precursor [Crocosphaera subtropica ATCC 51142]